jgi:trigger factor
MKTTVENVDPVTRKLTVEVEPKRVKQAFDRAAKELAKQVNLPGFRPGKAPRRLIEQRFGEGVIAQQAMEDALNTYYAEALDEAELVPVAMPEVDVQTFTEEEGCAFEATVQVRPEFDVPDHTGIQVTFPEWDVDDEDIDAQLDQMRERFAEVDEVDRAAETGDYVTLDLSIAVDGEELTDAAVEDAMYEVGSEGVTPKLDDEVVGKSAGDSFTYTDEMPEDYPEHGGKEAEFTVTVKDVREKALPELDDDFATTASEFDTLEELRQDIRNSLLRQRVQQARHDVRGRVLEAYLAMIDVPLPPAMVDAEVDARVGQIEQQAEQYGLEADRLFELEGTTRDEFVENARTQATDQVKAQLVLDELAEALELQVTPEDIDQEIVRHAQANNTSPQQIAQIVQQQGSIGALVGDILRRKTIDAIMAEATLDGGPTDDVLIELGLMPDPNAPEVDTDEVLEVAVPEASEDTSDDTSEDTSEDTSDDSSEDADGEEE